MAIKTLTAAAALVAAAAVPLAASAYADPEVPVLPAPPAPGAPPAPDAVPAPGAAPGPSAVAAPGQPNLTDGVPHLSSPDNLPPGSTMDPSVMDGADSPNVGYLKDLWHAVQNQEISGKQAFLLGIAQRGMNTPIPAQEPGPNVPTSPNAGLGPTAPNLASPSGDPAMSPHPLLPAGPPAAPPPPGGSLPPAPPQ
jgi:hypothetical protein